MNFCFRAEVSGDAFSPGWVCLTGDVHHRTLNTREAEFIEPFSEIELASKYMEIATRYNLKVTLFITGKTLLQEWEDVEPLIKYKNLEMGGHTFNAFQPLVLHRASKLFRGSSWLSRAQQEADIQRAVEIFKRRIGAVASWRTHSYEYDANTVPLLEEAGFSVWSDVMDKNQRLPKLVGNSLLSLPINVREDHSGVFHGYLTPESVARQSASISSRIKRSAKQWMGVSGGGGNMLLPPADWLEGIKQDVQRAADGGVAVMNLHPVCMYLLDEFVTFEKICQFLAAYKSIKASESRILLSQGAELE